MSDPAPLDDLYLEWLYRQIGSVRTRNVEQTYWILAKRMYSTEFLYFVPNDDNRASDGKDLREEFMDQNPDLPYDRAWMGQECSFFEVVIALARILDFEADTQALPGGVKGWFWKLMENVGLDRFNDFVCRDSRSLSEMDRIIKRVNNREYRPNGFGGFFPLEHTRQDQRKVELWYQLNEYLLDRHYVEL